MRCYRSCTRARARARFTPPRPCTPQAGSFGQLPALGVTFQTTENRSLRKLLRLDTDGRLGMLVVSVAPLMPAALAGVVPGDVVMKLDGLDVAEDGTVRRGGVACLMRCTGTAIHTWRFTRGAFHTWRFTRGVSRVAFHTRFTRGALHTRPWRSQVQAIPGLRLPWDYCVTKKRVGESIEIEISRDGQPRAFSVELVPEPRLVPFHDQVSTLPRLPSPSKPCHARAPFHALPWPAPFHALPWPAPFYDYSRSTPRQATSSSAALSSSNFPFPWSIRCLPRPHPAERVPSFTPPRAFTPQGAHRPACPLGLPAR